MCDYFDWLIHPDIYLPDPVTFINVVKWHLALDDMAENVYRYYYEKKIGHSKRSARVCGISTDNALSLYESMRHPYYETLVSRDREYICSLGYQVVALIETAMLIGRDLYYIEKCGHPIDAEERHFDRLNLDNLMEWARVYDVSLTAGASHTDVTDCYYYIVGKKTDYLKKYIKYVERQSAKI